jgi:multicomponent K+:H+ antiporter subunit C
LAFLVASAIGILVAAGVYLLLRPRTFSVIVGLALLSYAVNLFLFAMGRVVSLQPPLISATAAGYADPLPQALVLTAIVINLGMTALLLALAVRGRVATGTDHVDGVEGPDRSVPENPAS